MNIFKLANFICAKYNFRALALDHWGVIPTEGVAIEPDFKNGDLVRNTKNGRLAKFLSYVTWNNGPKDYKGFPQKALIFYVGPKGNPPKHHLWKLNQDYVNTLDLKHVS